LSIIGKSKEEQEQYWQDYATELIESAESMATEIAKGLKIKFRDAEKSIVSAIREFYGRFSDDDGMTITSARKRLIISELREIKNEIRAMINESKSLRLRESHIKYLQKAFKRSFMARLDWLMIIIRHEIEKLYMSHVDVFKTGLHDSYLDSYYFTIFNINKAIGVDREFYSPTEEDVENTILSGFAGMNYEDKISSNMSYSYSALELLIQIALASSLTSSTISSQINDAIFGKGKAKGHGGYFYRTIKLAQNEFNQIANEAAYDAYKESDINKYFFIAVLDNRTTNTCRNLDGQIFKMSERIDGVNFPPILSPPHPCRSTTAPYLENKDMERIANEYDGNIMSDNMSFNEWKKNHKITRQ
jgi:SPP1 gp7 family putative phage head morphogenesis protein